MAAAPTRFRHGRLYLTFRCNARCGYCNVWQDPVFDGHRELTADGLRRCLDELAELGVEQVDLTGGEPALHNEMTTAVRHAHEIGMAVDVTTNAIRFPEQAREIVPLVSTMNISLDTLSAERYHAIRGTDTLHRTVELVETLRAAGAGNLKLICVVSGQNVHELDDVVAFAQEHEVSVYLSPMFNYFATQSEIRPPGSVHALKLAAINGRTTTAPASVSSVPSSVLVQQVAERRYEPYTAVSLSFLHHLRTLDPAAVTTCGANSRIVTLGPDGRIMLPCYHEWDSSLAWDRPYRELVDDPELIRVRDQEVGQRPGCRGCAVFPYLGLPMSYQLTTRFLIQAFSEELIKLKWWAVSVSLSDERRRRLLERSDAVLAAIEQRSAALRAGGHLDELYHFAVADGGVRVDFAAEPVTVEELLADHAHDDCWRVQRTPHRIVRLLYADILPALSLSSSPSSHELLTEALDVHLDCWEILLGLLPGQIAAAAAAAAAARLGRWCARAGEVLRGHPGVSSLAVLATFSTLSRSEIASWGSVRGHAEELLAVKLLCSLADVARRAELAPLFAPSLVPALQGSRRLLPAPVDSSDPVPSPEQARQGVGLARFVAMLRRADTGTLREAVRRWKAVADPATAEDIERRLLRAELETEVASWSAARGEHRRPGELE